MQVVSMHDDDSRQIGKFRKHAAVPWSRIRPLSVRNVGTQRSSMRFVNCVSPLSARDRLRCQSEHGCGQ